MRTRFSFLAVLILFVCSIWFLWRFTEKAEKVTAPGDPLSNSTDDGRPERLKLGFGFWAVGLSTQEVRTLLIPFAPTLAEEAVIFSAYFSRARPFHLPISNALGSTRFQEFREATWPGRYYVAELVRIYGLEPKTIDEARGLFARIRKELPAPSNKLGERINQGVEIGREVSKLFPKVSAEELREMMVFSFPNVFPAGFDSWFEAEVRQGQRPR